MSSAKVILFLIGFTLVCADVYLHNPRGSNNRLDERNRNRANNNRLFDSQNNNKGGYNQNDMQYYAGSVMQVEWTNQHSCGNENTNCQIVFQYMCEAGTTGAGLRDGQVTTALDPENPDMVKYGRHETGEYYKECMTRQRNMGLFLADQNLNGPTAKYTRQNTNGQRSGFECPEERDYYPYWHPTPWRDAAILTDDLSRCAYYQAESQNVVNKGHCTGTRPEDPSDPDRVTDGAYYNNRDMCVNNGFSWNEDASWEIDPPECRAAPWSRDNHLGNGINGYANTYDWTLPDSGSETWTCVFRMRYNISTDDYDGWNTYSDMNGENSPIEDNPTVDLGDGINLKLALNTDQYGRTFQDRSSTFVIKPRPSDIPAEATIYNLNVKGQRGNIVQNFPSVEYDFTPSFLTCTAADYVHRQVTGSNTTPAGAGQGRESTDRSNFVELSAPDRNYPRPSTETTHLGDEDPTSTDGFAKIKYWALLNQNDNELDDAAPYQDFGYMKYTQTGAYHYMSSRTNNFTNRSQKGVINVVDAPSLSAGAIVGIAAGATLGVAAPAGLVAYGIARPESKIGSGLSAIKSKMPSLPSRGGGGASVPTGYSLSNTA
jgi:hypothetical protein